MWTWEIIVVLALLGLTLASFIREKWPTDLTALIAFGSLLALAQLPGETRLPTVEQLLGVLANPAPVTIAAMFILSAALEKTGVIERLASGMRGLARLGYTPTLLVLVLAVAGLSAFINNTPVVVIFLPVVLSLARQMQVPASKLLIPLSYASIFGGTCTLVGTSTNILASGLLEREGYAPLGMFELTAIAGPLLVLGVIYLATIGHRLLPRRESLTAILSDEERKEFLTEAFVPGDSELVGQTAKESGLLSKGVRVVEIIRNEVALREDLRVATLQAGDRLVLSCRPSGMAAARTVEGLQIGLEEGLATISAHEGSIVEGVIAPRSTIVGQTIRDLNFRQRFRMIILAIHRHGVNLRDKIDSVPLQIGDTILMMGTDQAREQIRRGDDILLLDHPPTPAADLRKKAPLVVGTLGVIIAMATFGLAPIAALAIVGVVVVLAAGCLTPKVAYGAVDWSILVLIYGMLGLGTAMQTSGTSDLLANGLLALTSLGLPPAWQPVLLLLALYLVTSLLTETLSNNATVVLMAPLALTLGEAAGLDPRPLVLAVCIASSASFSTPIGYQTNTYVYSVGGYKFGDFARVGLPLNAIYFLGTVGLSLFWWQAG